MAGALARLPDGDREVLLLTSWARLSAVEIAQALGIPAGTVRSRLHRVRRAGVFDRPGIDITAPSGDFSPSPQGAPSCADPNIRPGRQSPTPAWPAGLPTDPQGTVNRLRADAPHNLCEFSAVTTSVADRLGEQPER